MIAATTSAFVRPRLPGWVATALPMSVPLVFAIASSQFMLAAAIDPRSIGSHAAIYTAAAGAWINGADPWSVGPSVAVFAGPPPMLVPFVPFVAMPLELTRAIWTIGSLFVAILLIRRLGLPGWWLGFPPIVQAIYMGHPEILLLALVVFGGPLAGLAALVKPYFGGPMLAEKRWRSIGLALAVVVLSAPLLPWPAFFEQLPAIMEVIARQSQGDSIFGQPVLMAIAAGALASLGLRRALWLAGPLLWPAAQPVYKVACLPAMSPLLAVLWAIPIPGMTLAGLVTYAIADRVLVGRQSRLWLATPLEVIAARPQAAEPEPEYQDDGFRATIPAWTTS